MSRWQILEVMLLIICSTSVAVAFQCTPCSNTLYFNCVDCADGFEVTCATNPPPGKDSNAVNADKIVADSDCTEQSGTCSKGHPASSIQSSPPSDASVQSRELQV